MALTQSYCDYAAGNDYKGASFTDGAYTSATKTLVKANAFAASKVNHWLALSSNDGGSIVTGYYKIATWTDASTVILATDAGAGVDDDAAKCTQHDGTTSLPYRSVQGALDLITRNATDGDQINIKAGTAEVLAAALTLATYGTPTGAARLVLRGYTSAANDGGRGAINLAGFTFIAPNTLDFISIIDLDFSGGGAIPQIYLDDWCTIVNCKFTGTGMTASTTFFHVDANCRVQGCEFVLPPTGSTVRVGTASIIYGCYSRTNINLVSALAIGNIVNLAQTGLNGITIGGQPGSIVGNTIYNSTAGTVSGIAMGGQLGALAVNNIIVGFSGVGGIGISNSVPTDVVGYNAFYNCTTPKSFTGPVVVDLGNDVTLAADPFTDAASGDFSLTTAAKAALRGVGWPAAYLGAHANTDGHITIGAIQYGEAEAGGGGMLAANKRGNKQA